MPTSIYQLWDDPDFKVGSRQWTGKLMNRVVICVGVSQCDAGGRQSARFLGGIVCSQFVLVLQNRAYGQEGEDTYHGIHVCSR